MTSITGVLARPVVQVPKQINLETKIREAVKKYEALKKEGKASTAELKQELGAESIHYEKQKTTTLVFGVFKAGNNSRRAYIGRV